MITSSPSPGSQSAYTTFPAETARTGLSRWVVITMPSQVTPLARWSPKAAVTCPETGHSNWPCCRPNADVRSSGAEGRSATRTGASEASEHALEVGLLAGQSCQLLGARACRGTELQQHLLPLIALLRELLLGLFLALLQCCELCLLLRQLIGDTTERSHIAQRVVMRLAVARPK